jgi:hypothetical protein
MQDDLDRLIDSGLAGYSSAEPLEGLEQRVVQRVRAVEAARKRRRWWGLLALPATAALVFALLPANRIEVAATPPPPVREPIRAVTVRERLPRAPHHRRPVRSNPKREYFPTLTPLTPEEHVLVELARSKPQQLPPPPVQELEIKPIEIAPLVPDGRQ